MRLETGWGLWAGRDVLPTSPLAGARGGFRRAVRTDLLAALHLQRPEKHMNQVRTTSFLWFPD